MWNQNNLETNIYGLFGHDAKYSFHLFYMFINYEFMNELNEFDMLNSWNVDIFYLQLDDRLLLIVFFFNVDYLSYND